MIGMTNGFRGDLLLGMGVLLITLAICGAIFALILYRRTRKKLQQTLEQEYGAKRH